MLIDETHRVVHLSENAGRFLMPSGGPLSGDAVDLVRPELRFELRSALNRVFEHHAGLAGLRLGTKTARDRIEERADHLHVGVHGVQLRLDAVDELEHVVLIAARESERADRLLHGGESLMDLSKLRGIHGLEFEPVAARDQARNRPLARGASGQ